MDHSEEFAVKNADPAHDGRMKAFITAFQTLQEEVGKVIVGHSETINGVLTAMFAGGHVLLEGVPGLGKTLLVKTLANCLDLSFSRVQFTPDLMPGDILGTNVMVDGAGIAAGGRHVRFQPGPIFGNILLADEVNRATPKTQSALLEGMQEQSVTAGGVSHSLPQPFFVLATQNPIEMDGTYPLPEAQLDRFLFKLLVPFPTTEELNAILDRTTRADSTGVARVMDGPSVLEFRELIREVPIASHVRDFATQLIMASHPGSAGAPEVTRRYVRYGASPRGAQALVLGAKVRALSMGRYNVSLDDIRALAAPALRHRVLLNFAGESENMDPDALIAQLIAHVEGASNKAAAALVN